MQTVDLSSWEVGDLLLYTPGAGDYRVTREPSGLYMAAMREHAAGCWQVFGEGYQTVVEAVRACERDLFARLGGVP